ncbi:Uncharacterized protein Adt_02911 [Abeliophyllum distichum]|uniref:Uncharacterized protein n=1 Tax=Abeliophyllum distichum TaxID=126358 RepID=A0ABD1VX20_9LAMI
MEAFLSWPGDSSVFSVTLFSLSLGHREQSMEKGSHIRDMNNGGRERLGLGRLLLPPDFGTTSTSERLPRPNKGPSQVPRRHKPSEGLLNLQNALETCRQSPLSRTSENGKVVSISGLRQSAGRGTGKCRTAVRGGVSWSRTRSRRLSRQSSGRSAADESCKSGRSAPAAVDTQQDRQQVDSAVGSG